MDFSEKLFYHFERKSLPLKMLLSDSPRNTDFRTCYAKFYFNNPNQSSKSVELLGGIPRYLKSREI